MVYSSERLLWIAVRTGWYRRIGDTKPRGLENPQVTEPYPLLFIPKVIAYTRRCSDAQDLEMQHVWQVGHDN